MHGHLEKKFLLKFRIGRKVKEGGTALGQVRREAEGSVLGRDPLRTRAAAVPLHWAACASSRGGICSNPSASSLA